MHEFRVSIVTRKMRDVKVKLKHQLSWKLFSEGGGGTTCKLKTSLGRKQHTREAGVIVDKARLSGAQNCATENRQPLEQQRSAHSCTHPEIQKCLNPPTPPWFL